MSLAKNVDDTTVVTLHDIARSRALELGRVIDEASASADEEGRIHLNPILDKLKELVGVAGRLDSFKAMRADVLKRMAKGGDVSKIYTTLRGNTPSAGTWVTPQLAVLAVCYFWPEFQLHAIDVYHRYVTNDVSLAVEIVENSAEKEGFAVMKLAEMESKMEEFMATERSARMELEAKLGEKTKLLERRITAESKKLKLDVDEIETQVNEFEDTINGELAERDSDFQDYRQELNERIEVPIELLGIKKGKSMKTILTALRRWWNECTEPSEGDDGKLWVAEELLPEFRKWAERTGHDGPSLAGLFRVYSNGWIKSGDVTSLTWEPELRKADAKGKIRKRDGFVGRRICADRVDRVASDRGFFRSGG